MAESFKARYSRLDVLVNNAGAFFNKRRANTLRRRDDLSRQPPGAVFADHDLLLDTLQNSAPARIVNVSSDGHNMARWILTTWGSGEATSG